MAALWTPLLRMQEPPVGWTSGTHPLDLPSPDIAPLSLANARTGIDIPLARINSVEFRHGLIDRMVRTGTLIIESASQDPLEFNDIPQVERVHSLLYHEVFDTLGGEESDSRSPGRR